MKKTTFTKSAIAVLSAAVMTALSATPAFAEDKSTSWTNPCSTQNDVIILIGGSGEGEDVVPTEAEDATFKVAVAWESLVFTYTGGVWSADDGAYKGGTLKAGDKEAATVKVTNYSNWGISYTAGFEDSALTKTEKGVTATLAPSKEGDSLADGVAIGYCAPGTEKGSEPSSSFTVTAAESDSGVTADTDFKLGTVTVQISAATSAPSTSGAGGEGSGSAVSTTPNNFTETFKTTTTSTSASN